MGTWGWFHWLSEQADKIKTVRDMTTDAEQLKILDELIEEFESKKEEE